MLEILWTVFLHGLTFSAGVIIGALVITKAYNYGSHRWSETRIILFRKADGKIGPLLIDATVYELMMIAAAEGLVSYSCEFADRYHLIVETPTTRK